MQEEKIEQNETKEPLPDELYKEVQEYYRIARDNRMQRYRSNQDNQVYVIEKNFLRRWKHYINYQETKRDIQLSNYNYNFKKNVVYYNPKFHPGEINNSSLLISRDSYYNDGDDEDVENFVMKNDLCQKQDFKFINLDLWNFFHSKYKGGPVLKKLNVEEGTKSSFSSRKFIEIFYKKFNIIFLVDRKELNIEFIENLNSKPIYISKVKILTDLKKKILKIYNQIFNKKLGLMNLKLWKLNCNLSDVKAFLTQNLRELNNTNILFNVNELTFIEYLPELALSDLDMGEEDLCLIEISDESDFVLEVKKLEMKEDNCEWCRNRRLCRYPCICKEVWYCTENCRDKDVRFHEDKCKKKLEIEESMLIRTDNSKLGIVGLSNLGNTCFMNTALQCMSNCWELTGYFLQKHFKNHINLDNPIGSQGRLANSYGNLMSNLWYGSNSVISPFQFKRAIEGFQTMFSGYQQHDTQEFLNYLLDGLHEDLNKVLKKPLVEKDESKREDEIKSRDCWIGFLRRNQSLLVDLLYGQYKSTLYCPNEKCGNISTTFDPFLSLSLPLVAYTHPYYIECYFIFFDTNVLPIKLRIPFTTECTIMAFRNKISVLLNIHPFSFLIGRLENGSFENFLSSSNLLGKGYGQDRTMYLMQIDPSLFYSTENSYFNGKYENRDYTKLASEVKSNEEVKDKIFNEDYEENEDGKTKESLCYYSRNYSGIGPASLAAHFPTKEGKELLLNVDENYGFDNNYLNVLMFLKSYDEFSNSSSCRKRIIFPRMIYINKNWSTIELHLKVFEFFLPILDKYEKKTNSEYNINFDKATPLEKFMYFFKNYDTDPNNDNVDYQKQCGFPYRIRIKNINTYYIENCYFCDKQKCDDCFLPYDKTPIHDIIRRIPTNDGLEIDNTFLFLKECQKFNSVKNKDFSLEITFLPKFHQAVRELNEFDDLSFTSVKTQGSKTIKIDDCFKLFVKLETLKENNEWYCPQCKEHQKADKKMEIYKAPKVLVVHLKRFSSHQKIDTLVDFPIYNLDLNNYVKSKNENEELVYDLFAISNHYGGLGGGHYIAFAKNHITNIWYKFDDSSVYQISEGDLVSSSAYVLFYRRRSNNPEDIEKLYNKPFINYENNTNNNTTMSLESTYVIGDGNTNVDMVIDPPSIPPIDNAMIEEEYKNISS